MKKEPEIEDLENSQLIYIVKDKKVCSGESTKDMAGQTFAGEIRHMMHESIQPTQQKYSQLGLKRTKIDEMKKGCWACGLCQAGSRPTELRNHKYTLFFKKREE